MLTDKDKENIYNLKFSSKAKDLSLKYNISPRTVYKIWSDYEMDQDPDVKEKKKELKRAIALSRLKQLQKKIEKID